MVSDNHPDPPESGLDRYVSDSSTGPLAPTHTPAAGKAAEPQEIEQADELSDVNVQDPPGSLPQYERLLGVSEDAFEQPTTSRKELWSYYLYYNGDSGVGPNNYGPTLFQSKLNASGWDPRKPKEIGNCEDVCVVPWGNGTRNTSSIVLLANGLCFAFMTVFFVWFGSAADFGSFGRWLLLVPTVVCWAFQYGMMGIKTPEQWPAAMGLYMVGFIAYGATLVFYAAIFPRLARYMPHVRKAREEDLAEGKITQEEYDKIESLERNHISSISTAHSNIGYLLTLVINLSVLIPLEGNPYADNWALFLTNTYWVVLGTWWFVFQQKRPGPKLPKGSSYLTIGWKQVYMALRDVRHLPQTFIYLVAFFLLADGLNTTSFLVSIIQAQKVKFSFLQTTYYGLAQACTSTFSTFSFWYIQKYFKISTKRMFMVTNVFTVFITFYGMLGLWSDKVGYHHLYDFWFYNILFGLFQAPYYAYAQTMMSEVTPRGYENFFFALFGITNRASSIIGPNVVQAIINKTNNNWQGFPFLFSLCAAASITIWFVDIEKGRENCRQFVKERNIARVRQETGATVKVSDSVDPLPAATA